MKDEYLDPERSYEFTQKAWNGMYMAVDSEYFGQMDAELIYESLEKQLEPVPFGDYLKRYLYARAGLTGSYREVPLKDYQALIMGSFRDRLTPPSFTPTTARLSALSKNWLTQQTVKRQVVLLLGFGLGMSTADVNDFLHKALHERMLDRGDPTEAICEHCYTAGKGYPAFERLRSVYETLDPKHPPAAQAGEEDLLRRLCALKGSEPGQTDQARKHLLRLWAEAREMIAGMHNSAGEEACERLTEALRDRLSRSDRLSDQEKLERLRQERTRRHIFTAEEITENDLEQILYAAVPTDRHGNLTPIRDSTLADHFEGKRLSRKRLNDLLHRRSPVDRFDLITLSFFIAAAKVDEEPNSKKRYIRYITQTNRILADCGMGPLYVTNPYECFVLMCLLSVSPLETFSEVWEKSYENQEGD
ncbi:MAG: hypothetical protein IJK28_07700 [Clostridia bacterium]|nr:hypothetical protein [Clostridia bacterium]